MKLGGESTRSSSQCPADRPAPPKRKRKRCPSAPGVNALPTLPTPPPVDETNRPEPHVAAADTAADSLVPYPTPYPPLWSLRGGFSDTVPAALPSTITELVYEGIGPGPTCPEWSQGYGGGVLPLNLAGGRTSYNETQPYVPPSAPFPPLSSPQPTASPAIDQDLLWAELEEYLQSNLTSGFGTDSERESPAPLVAGAGASPGYSPASPSMPVNASVPTVPYIPQQPSEWTSAPASYGEPSAFGEQCSPQATIGENCQPSACPSTEVQMGSTAGLFDITNSGTHGSYPMGYSFSSPYGRLTYDPYRDYRPVTQSYTLHNALDDTLTATQNVAPPATQNVAFPATENVPHPPREPVIFAPRPLRPNSAVAVSAWTVQAEVFRPHCFPTCRG